MKTEKKKIIRKKNIIILKKVFAVRILGGTIRSGVTLGMVRSGEIPPPKNTHTYNGTDGKRVRSVNSKP